MDFTPGSENRKILNQEFNQQQYKEFRDWYFTNHTVDQLASYKTHYYQHLELHQKLIPFVEWYHTVTQSQLTVIEDQYKVWTTTEGQVIHSIHSSSSDEDDPEEPCPCSTNQEQISEINYWKSIVEMNGLNLGEPSSINVLTDAQSVSRPMFLTL